MSPYAAWPFRSDPSHPFASELWALLIHGVIALIVVGPLIWRSRHRVGYAVLAFAGGSALDLDHVVAAGSLDPHTLETLSGGRPDTHSLAFVVLLTLLVLVVWQLARAPGSDRRAPWVAAWCFLAVNGSHLLFDGAGGNERVLYPFSNIDGFAWVLCPIGVVALAAVSFVIAERRARGGVGERRAAADALASLERSVGRV